MKTIKKQAILDELKLRVQKDLTQAKSAFKSTKGHATDSELKSDGKYDTRSIEAGYLAGAQKKRVDELELELGLLDEININHLPSEVSVGSLAEIEFNKMKRLYFISSTSGGTMLEIEGETILVISAFSPIGAAAIGLSVGDTFEVETATNTREYTILSIG